MNTFINVNYLVLMDTVVTGVIVIVILRLIQNPNNENDFHEFIMNSITVIKIIS